MKQFYLLPILVITPLFGQSLQPPTFSHESGFYNEEFQLNLTHEDPEVQIIYTLDGSEPDINNLNGRTYQFKKKYPELPGQLPFEFHTNTLISYNFTDPILVYNRTNEPNRISEISTSFQFEQYFPEETIEKSFLVRAKAYYNSQISETVTHVYFVNARNSTLPIINFTTDDEKLFGYEKGLFTAGSQFDNWRLNNPNQISDAYANANYWASGSSSEIQVNLIYFENKELKINQDAGLRNNGNGTRYLRNRPFRIYAKEAYGRKNFNHNFFSNYDYNKFKRLILRNSGQDTERTLFRDALVHKLNEHLYAETQNYQPVSTFVNGEYYGIFNLRERYDEKYFERVFGLEEDEIDYLENDGVVDLGDELFYNETIAFFTDVDLSTEEMFRTATQYVDEINVADYHIAGIFAANFDWPQNNNVFFRKRVNYNNNERLAHDGRWRWIIKDYDIAFDGGEGWIENTFSHNTLSHSISNTLFDFQYTNHILKGLLTNVDYKNYFINRFSDLLNTSYKPSNVINLINRLQDVIRPEMPKHIARWKLIPSLESWESEVEKLRNFATERPTYQKQHLIDFFNLDGTYQLTTNVDNVEQGFVKINTIEINNSTVGIDGDYSTWSGDYFKGVPVKLSAIALPGYEFSHWIGDIESNEAELIVNGTEDINVTAVFERSLSTGDLDKVDFLVYPNPTADVLNIASASTSEIKFSISNMLGQQLEAGITKDQTLNVSHLAKGVYLIELNQDQKRVVKKFIKK